MKEDKPLYISDSFNEILKSIDHPISSDILYYNSNSDFVFPFSYLDITLNDDIITFLPCNKIEKVENYYKNKYRQEIRIGKLINKISWKFNNSIIEDFVNKYKGYISILNNKGNFEIFEGDNIPKYYSEKSYTSGGGSINKSCMRHSFCDDYFDIYVFNKKCKLLVLFDKDRKRILGRSLIWYVDEPKDAIVMDRIYTINDSLVYLFIDYAEKNNFYYKPRQSHDENLLIYNKNVSFTKLKVYLENINYKKYPYFDTLQYYNIVDKYLTNDENEYNSNPDFIRLRDIHGKYKENEYFVMDVHNKKIIHRDNAIFCEIGDSFTLKEDAVYIEHIGKYCLPKLVVKSELDQKNYRIGETVFSHFMNTYIPKKKSIKVYKDENNYDYYHINQYDRFYYHSEDDRYYVNEFKKNDNYLQTEIDDEHFEFFKYLTRKI